MDIDKELRQHKFIIFGFDHYNTLGAVRSLGEKGILPIIVIWSNKPYLTTSSKYAKYTHLVDSVKSGYNLILTKYGNESKKPFLYSCDDFVESYLDEHQNEVKEKFFFFNGNRQGIINHYMNKDAINNLAIKCGCNVPKSEILKKNELPKTLKYPVITKTIMSIRGGWKDDVFICYSENELKEAYIKIKGEDLLIMEFVDKKNELCLDGFSYNNGKDIYIPYQTTYIRVAPGKYGNYMTLEPFKNDTVYTQVQKIIEEIGFNGIFSVEYLIDKNDKLFFLEVNFRNSTWSYAYTYGGANLLYEWAKATLVGKLDLNSIQTRNEPFTAMVEPRDFFDFVRAGDVSLSQWIKDVFNTDCYFYYNKKDIKPFVKYIYNDILLHRLKNKFINFISARTPKNN